MMPQFTCGFFAFSLQNILQMHYPCIFIPLNAQLMQMDSYDLKILAALQSDGRLTNQQLADAVNLSPSQCSRRRSRLEQDGIIRGYRAELSRENLGFELEVFISVTLARHNPDNSRYFAELVGRLPEIQEAHALTGEMDYMLKAVLPDLKSLNRLVSEALLPHESVQNVRSTIVLETLKRTSELPVDPR